MVSIVLACVCPDLCDKNSRNKVTLKCGQGHLGKKKGGGILDVESGKGLKPNQSGFGKQIRQAEVKTQSRKITSTFRLPITLHYTTV